jgi:two-component system phosphate regulon sensor histidine kinase PhoR
MGWVAVRVLLAIAATLLGGWIGFTVSDSSPVVAALTGAGCAAAAISSTDLARGYRLLRWLRGTQEAPAPRDTGLWGELAYRVERSLRMREREIAHERTRLSQFLNGIEASPNGVLLADANHQIDWCNAVAADHFGLDPQRDRGQPLTNLIRAPAFVSYLQSGRYEDGVTFANPRAAGTLAVIVRPYAEGQLLVLSQDITERERADAMRRDFVANVSHEIRTPLTVLAGFVETLNGVKLTEAERKRVLELMQQQTDRMQALVGDLLTLARLEGSPRPPPDRWVDLDGLLARVESDARALSAGRHSIEFTSETGAQLAGAEAELLSAIGNVVSNAVRYTPEGGRIDVSWSTRTDGRGVLEVRDTGIGIAREHIPRIVERFYRVDTSRARDTGGTGLGLSIVKHVMQRHGGELEIESSPGRGSSFRLVLPSARVRQRPSEARPAKALVA